MTFQRATLKIDIMNLLHIYVCIHIYVSYSTAELVLRIETKIVILIIEMKSNVLIKMCNV